MFDEIVKEGDAVKVFLKRQNTNELLEHDIPWLLTGAVMGSVSDTEFEIATDQKDAELKKDVSYIIYFFSFEKVYLCTAYFKMDFYEEQKRVIAFEILSPLERVQRRMHQRVSSHTTLLLQKEEDVQVENLMEKADFFDIIEEKTGSRPWKEVMIDLSAGGIRFTSKERLKAGETVRIARLGKAGTRYRVRC